ncbi:RNA 3'-phosphate cyclase [Candidatus Woesearchaeota archaeon CG10_big_fil_rev_8_21_14_0_10_37_12]|nr:MAG: RNA 3'-phosphate cyclase [Candidatus Woesearchaeota archaeon CG10_big_fil_rev_8_21_14_0_10_37_12]
MILIDGNQGEGGGQIIRTALALSCLTGKPFKATNIRGGRENSGLKAQHVAAIKALKKFCNAKTDGDEIGSKKLLFIPGKITAKNIVVDVGTAGSMPILLQAIILPCIFANKTHTITFIGGTDVSNSASIDYFHYVILPYFKQLANIELKILKRGYYPKGQGKIELTIKPKIKLSQYNNFEDFLTELQQYAFQAIQQGKLIQIKGISHASINLETAQVAERQATAAEQLLKNLGVPINIRVEYAQTESKGSGITLWAVCTTQKNDLAKSHIFGADALGEQGKPAELVGSEAAQQLLETLNSKTPIDAHLADNLMPLIALCRPSEIVVQQITPHTKTNIAIAEKFLGQCFKINGKAISTVVLN